jgi:hypothetical protein
VVDNFVSFKRGEDYIASAAMGAIFSAGHIQVADIFIINGI